MKNLIPCLILCLLFFGILKSNAQTFSEIYLFSNPLLDPVQEKYDLKLGVCYNALNFGWGHNINLQTAFSPFKNFGAMFSYRTHFATNKIDTFHHFNINEYSFGLGFYKKRKSKKGEKKYNVEKESLKNNPLPEKPIRAWRNKWRAYNGKTTNKIKIPYYLFNIYASYGFAKMNSKRSLLNIGTGFGNIEYDEFVKNKSELERYNIDIGVSYFTMKAFSFSYNFRASLVDFKKSEFETYGTAYDYSNLEEEINLLSPYNVFESNLKFAYSVINFEFYLQTNSVFKSKYNKLVRDGIFGLGVIYNFKELLSNKHKEALNNKKANHS